MQVPNFRALGGGGMFPQINCYTYSRGQPHPKYKANSARTSHITVWETRSPIVRGDWGRVERWP